MDTLNLQTNTDWDIMNEIQQNGNCQYGYDLLPNITAISDKNRYSQQNTAEAVASYLYIQGVLYSAVASTQEEVDAKLIMQIKKDYGTMKITCNKPIHQNDFDYMDYICSINNKDIYTCWDKYSNEVEVIVRYGDYEKYRADILPRSIRAAEKGIQPELLEVIRQGYLGI